VTSATAVPDLDWGAEFGVAAEVRRVLAAATEADGRSPLNEASLLSLQHHRPAGLWVVRSGDTVAGLAVAPGGTSDSGSSGGTSDALDVGLVVAPPARGAGLGAVLADAVLDRFGDRPLAAWSHGNHPAAAALAASRGFTKVRDLWQMRRPLDASLPAPVGSPGVVVRTFRSGDEDPVLRVNAAAFAHHPEQGGMTRTDLEERKAEPWFDPAGFFLAERDGELLGFHWTKVHETPQVGEVYVVGISPAAQGMGLGKLLTLTGLQHLREAGLPSVMLYVEADNAAAVRLYEGLGFTHAAADTDVQYRREPAPVSPR
jgi:mycothiol synthase